jgi:hypothetical protein
MMLEDRSGVVVIIIIIIIIRVLGPLVVLWLSTALPQFQNNSI